MRRHIASISFHPAPVALAPWAPVTPPTDASTRSRLRRRLRVATVAALGAALALPVSAGAADKFLRLTGPQYAGESRDPQYTDAIHVQSASFNIKRASRAATAATFGNLVITKPIDRSSPALMLAAANRSLIPSARLSMRDAEPDVSADDTPTPYVEYCFENIIVMSDEMNADAGDEAPFETVTFSYQKVTQVYNHTPETQETKSIVAGWSLLDNRALSVFPQSCGTSD